MSERVLKGAVELIEVYAVDSTGAALTGLTDLYIRIRRDSDGFYYDWNDSTFKNAGWTTLNGVLTEADSTRAPGVYSRSFTTPSADATYTVIPLQTPGTTAKGLAPDQLRVGSYTRAETETASMQADTLTATAIAASAITAAKFATDAIDANALAASAVTEIQTGLATATALATAQADLTTLTGRLTSTRAGYLDNLTNLDAAVSTRATAAALTSLTNAIIALDTTAASGSTATSVRTGATQASGFFDGMVLVVVNAAGTAARLVNSYSNTNGAFTVDALPFTPSVSDRVVVLSALPSNATGIAGAVWDVARAGHATAGTFGEGVNLSSPAVASIVTSGPLDASRLDVAVSTRASAANLAALDARVPAALVGGRMDASVGAMANDVVTAAAIATDAIGASELAASAANKVRDTILSDATPFPGASITEVRLAELGAANMPADIDTLLARLTSTRAGYLDNLTNLDAAISSRASAVDITTLLSRLTSTRANLLDNLSSLDASISSVLAAIGTVAAGVWDVVLAGHTTAGTTGAALAGANAPSAATVAAAVWDQTRTGHTTAGTFGESAALVDVAVSSRATAADMATLLARLTATRAGYLDNLTNLDAAISTVLARLPAALVGGRMDSIVDAIDASVVTTIQSGLATLANQTTILTRLTAQRAANLDNLDVAVSTRAVPGDAMTLTGGAQTSLVTAVWNETLPGAHPTNSAGERLATIDATVTTNLDEPISTRAASTGTVRLSFTLDSISNTVTVNTWLEIDGAPVTAGVSAATLVLYSAAGAVLSTPSTAPTPDARGVFVFAFTPPAFGVGETPTYAVGTITHSAVVYTGETGVTFARTS